MKSKKNNFIHLTHAKVNQGLAADPNQIAFVWFSPEHNATLVMSSGGGLVPVKEDVKQIVKLIIGEKKNGKN